MKKHLVVTSAFVSLFALMTAGYAGPGALAGKLPQWVATLGASPQLTRAAAAVAPLTSLPTASSHASGALRPGDYDLSAHQSLSRVILLIRENYVEPDRIKPYEMFLAALDYIQRTVPEVMVDDAEAPARITVSVGGTQQAFDLGGLDQLWEVTMALRDIFRFLQTHVTDPTEQRNIEYAAINGMLSTLDPHSVLMKPESFDEMKLSTKGEFGGLGIVISLRDGGLTIISPIEGTPASEAGLKAKDRIVKIGEESTINMGLDEAVQRLRGAPESKVTISVMRKGFTEAKVFVLKRAIIKIESVSAKLLEDGVGYVKIKSFQGNTYDDLQTHLQTLKQQNSNRDLRGLVLDLRNNPGGLLDQAILVSDRFIERGPLVITVGEGNRKREVKNAHVGLDESTYPIVVLVNGGSASASEIVAGALKNHDRAVVLGQQSFGKGSVQVLYDFKDRSALKLTIAQYLTPGDISIQSLGVVPDVLVIPAAVEKDGIHLFVDDESPREKDLEKHLEQHGTSKLVVPSSKLYHLLPTEHVSEDGEAEADASIAHVTGKFDYDFEISLAHDMLRKARSLARPQILSQAASLLAGRAEQEDGHIAKRMGELGIDWTQGTQSPAAKAKLVLHTSAGNQAIVAGETLTLTAELTNEGSTPLYRAWATSRSENPLFKNLEFAFGKLKPQERKTWQVQVKLPKDMVARADEVSLVLGDAPDAAHSDGKTFVTITEQKKPDFAFRYSVDDSLGNGDGLLQPGEEVTLHVEVTNIGPGVSEETTVSAKNLSGESIFLSEGRCKIGKLLPGESKKAQLRFTVHGKASAAQATATAQAEDGDAKAFVPAKMGDTLALRLMIWDGALGVSIVEKLQFPVAPASKSTPMARKVKIKAGQANIWAAAKEGGLLRGYAVAGTSLLSDASFGPYLRVDLGAAGVGFVHQQCVDKQTRPQKPMAHALVLPHGVVLAPSIAAPQIVLEPTALIVDQEIFHLRGTISDPRALKDMFVFIGDKKVYFRFLSSIAKVDGSFRYAFDIPVKLKPGTNALALFVREDEELASRRLFHVHRTNVQVAPVAAPEIGRAP